MLRSTLRLSSALAPALPRAGAPSWSVGGAALTAASDCSRMAAVSCVPSSPAPCVGVGVAAAPLAGGRRHMGLLDKMKDGLEQQRDARMDAKRQELFQAQIAYLASIDAYNMSDHLLQLNDTAKAAGLTGWKSTLRSSAKQQELENQFAEIKIGEALLPSEVADPKTVTRRAKLRISSDLGVDVSQVNRFFQGFEEMRHLHKWVRGRLQRGQPLPSSAEQYRQMVMSDMTGTSGSRAKKQMGRVRGMRAMYKQR